MKVLERILQYDALATQAVVWIKTKPSLKTKDTYMEVKLTLSWDNKDNYSAEVKTQTLDTCYLPVSIKLGLPSGMSGIPEVQYITATYSHDTKGKECGQIVRWQTQDISGIHSAGKPFGVTAYVVVNGKVMGMDHKKFPRGKTK